MCNRISKIFFLLGLLVLSNAKCYALSSETIKESQNFRLNVYQVNSQTYRIIVFPSKLDIERELMKDKIINKSFSELRLLISSQNPENSRVKCNDNLSIQIDKNPFKVAFINNSDKVIQKLEFNGDLNEINFRCGNEVLTGLGGGNKGIDRRGNYYPMASGQIKNDYVFFGASIPIPFLMSLENWGLFVNKPYNCEFDLRKAEGKILLNETKDADSPIIDLFVFIDENTKGIINEFSALTGRAELPPKWTLGYMQSHRTLSGSDEVLQIAHTFREKELPCDALIYLGTGFCPAGWNLDHGSLDFNPAVFENPKEIVNDLKKENFKVVLHVNRPPVDLYGAFSDSNIDKNDPAHIANYWKKHEYLTDMGIEGFWPDEGDELSPESKLARHRMYFEGPLSQKTNQRPFSLHRTGYAGIQKYGGWIWSGDVWSTWESLKEQVASGINFSVGGSPYWGSDIGGFNATPELTGELYVRWFEFGCFSPSFRAHGRSWQLRLPWGWNMGGPGIVEMEDFIDGRGNPDDAEFHNSLIEPICKKYLELRYQLLPYNYSLCWEANQNGLPLMRPLWLEFPDDPICKLITDQYLWGESIMIAPVTESKVFSKEVYLPNGGWYDFWTNRYYVGNQAITSFAGIGYIPMFIHAGAIIPFDPVRQYASEQVKELTTIRIYTGANGDFQYYNDDGISYNYKNDDYDLIHFKWSDKNRNLEVIVDNLSGNKNENKFMIQLIPEMITKEIQLIEAVQTIGF